MKKKSISPVVTGLAAAALLGTATYVVTSKTNAMSSRNMKRNAGKALKTVGGLMENVSYMMK